MVALVRNFYHIPRKCPRDFIAYHAKLQDNLCAGCMSMLININGMVCWWDGHRRHEPYWLKNIGLEGG